MRSSSSSFRFGNHLTILTIILVGLAVVIVGDMSDTTMATDVEEDAASPPTCRNLLMLLGKRVKMHKTTCIRQIRRQYKKDKDFDSHFQCAVKCYMQLIQMTDDSHQLNNQTFEKFLQVHVPLSYQMLAHKVLFPCVDMVAKKVDPQDEKCEAYGSFMECLTVQASEHC